MTGRGAWTSIGMPPGAGGFYKLFSPLIGSEPTKNADFQAVNFGVKVIQMRLNGIMWANGLFRPSVGTPMLVVDGVFGTRTDQWVRWAQRVLGLISDGKAGPKTLLAMLWPVVKIDAGPIAKTIGGICQNESGWDPGAVGYFSPEDHGLMQINALANPTVKLSQAFNHRFAFQYATKRINAALATYNNLDIAIASYNSPAWAQQWFRNGYPPNAGILAYVERIKAWNPS